MPIFIAFAEEGGRYTIPSGLEEYMMVCRSSEKVRLGKKSASRGLLHKEQRR